MDLKKLEKFLANESSFRLKQIKKAIFQDLVEDWQFITTLPNGLRQKLSKNFKIFELNPKEILFSKNNETAKALFILEDGFKIETVLMKHKNSRRTVCLSSQVGCALNCQFCATGQQGFKRNLTDWEIIEQVLFFARLLKKNKEKITNIVFMGMGEPFLNYDNVMEAIKTLNDKNGFNLGARHISISTAGITEGIEKLAEEKLQINLAFSLHAPNNNLRQKLMPINKKYPIEEALKTIDNYVKKTKRRVMFEYLMIDKVNDSLKEARELASLMKNPLYFINLISFNPVGHSKFKPSTEQKIKKFKEVLEKAGIVVTQRYRFGQEIKAACGQLSSKN